MDGLEQRDYVISLSNVSKTYQIRDKESDTIRDKMANLFSGSRKRKIVALENINVQVKKGEVLGIIGRNGSGKSTLIHIMTGTIPPDPGGEAEIHGKYMRMSLGMGFNKELTARQNIMVNASVMGISKKQIKKITPDIIEFAELHDFVDTKLKYFSKGMKARLSFSVAIHAEADIFLMDEFLGGVGDAAFKKKANRIYQSAFADGRTIIHVSHNMNMIKKHCDRVLLLDRGKQVALGTPMEVVKQYEVLSNK